MNIYVDYNFLVYIVNNSSMKKTQQEWLQESKKANIIIFFYKEMVLNLTSFLKFHPGGTKALMPYVNKDITDILFNVFPHHKQQTNRVLDQYRIGYNTSSSDYNEQKKSLVKQPKIEFKSKKKVVKKQNFNEPSQRGRKNKTNALAQVKLNKSKSKSKSTKNLTSIKEILEKYHEQQRKKKSYAELLKQRVKQQKEKVKVVFITFQDDLDLQNQSQQNKQTINIPILKPIFIHKP